MSVSGRYSFIPLFRISVRENSVFSATFTSSQGISPIYSLFVATYRYTITEQELLSKEALERKTSKGFLGAVALDDYGSGYNSEKSLLALSPKYIKVDMVIIRDIDTDIDKQQIVANIVKYAHQRGMYIVAEGVETAEELKKVLELEVDLLQGYYLSRPAATPGAINPDALKIIEENRKR